MKTMLRCALALVCVRAAGASALDDEKKPPVPVRVYTNDDLRRVAPYRDETGVNSRPAAAPAGAASSSTEKGTHGEEYWRREADRLRDRLRPLRERAAELRLRSDARRRQPGVRPVTDPQLLEWERRLRDLEERIAEAQSRLEDRARRERAMPGWIR